MRLLAKASSFKRPDRDHSSVKLDKNRLVCPHIWSCNVHDFNGLNDLSLDSRLGLAGRKQRAR